MSKLGAYFAVMGLGALFVAPIVSANPLKPSMKEQVKLGERVSKEIQKKEKLLPAEDARVRLLRRVGNRLIDAIPNESTKPWIYTFDVIDNDEINAFALPGGPIYFYSGLIDRMKTEDELAAVVAHEMAHIRKEHWARAYADQQARGLGLTLGLLILNANSTLGSLASVSSDLILDLPYSRRQESEADREGLKLMVDAGFNPYAALEVFRLLQAESKGGKPPEWLSTHPDTSRRLRDMEQQIKSYKRSSWPRMTPMPHAVTSIRKKLEHHDKSQPRALPPPS